MYDALAEGVVKRQATFEDDADGAVHRQQLVDRAIVFERGAFHVFHHDPGPVRLDHRIINFDNVRVIKPTPGRAFGLEKLAQTPRHGGVVLIEANQLDGDRMAPVRIIGQIDDRRGSLAQGLDDLVFADFFHDAEFSLLFASSIGIFTFQYKDITTSSNKHKAALEIGKTVPS